MGYQLRCVCGKEATIEAASIGRPFTCKGCRVRSVAVWGIDSKTKKAAAILLDVDQGAPRGIKIPLGMFELPCPCGVRLYARPRETGKRVQCPVCATWLKLEHSKDPQSLETRIRVVKSRLNQLPAAPSEPAPAPADTNVQFILCSCGESFPVDPKTSGNQASCPECGTKIRLELRRNADNSSIVVARQTTEEAAPSEVRGIDEELSLDDFT